MFLQKSINSIFVSSRLCTPLYQAYLKHLVPQRSNCAASIFVNKINYCQEVHGKTAKGSSMNGDFIVSHLEVEQSLESSSQRDECRDKKEEDELQSVILKASLPFIYEFGWSVEAISKGAESLGYSSMIHGMFPNGGTDIINYFYEDCNIRLEKELKELAQKRDEQHDKESATQFIRKAVELRLRMNIEYIDTWPQALALHLSPSNAPNALHNIGTLMDIIWYYAGDRSTDFSWYAKRGVLATVYKGTELCMLQDKSPDFQDTWEFLDRRLEEVKAFAKCIRQADFVGKDFGNIGQVGLITALNILGMNVKSR